MIKDDVAELISRLQKISPMPDDDDASAEALKEYEAITDQLSQFNDVRMIQPVIESFGYGFAYGLYQSAVGLLEQFSPQQLFPFLIDALKSTNIGSRMWVAVMLGRIRDCTAIPHLLPLLSDSSEYVRYEVVNALGKTGEPNVKEHIEKLTNDPSPEVRSAVKRQLASF